jgi:hypothetical protein
MVGAQLQSCYRVVVCNSFGNGNGTLVLQTKERKSTVWGLFSVVTQGNDILI